MPACHQATGCRPQSSAVIGDQTLLPCSNMTQDFGARRVSGSLVVADVPDLKGSENASLPRNHREPLCETPFPSSRPTVGAKVKRSVNA
jgi:hypothetical protein